MVRKKEKKTRTAIDQGSFYKLCKLMEAAREELIRTRPSNEALAARYAKTLGCEISPATIAKAKKVTGVHWRVIRGTGKNAAQLKLDIMYIARNLNDLRVFLGEASDYNLQEIVSRYSSVDGNGEVRV